MSFIQQVPKPFAREDIEKLNPNQIGVYGLFNNSKWIYVGKGDIRERLLAHWNGDNQCIKQEMPTHWVGEVMQGDPSAREQQLILELQPTCNMRVG